MLIKKKPAVKLKFLFCFENTTKKDFFFFQTFFTTETQGLIRVWALNPDKAVPLPVTSTLLILP